MRYFIVLLCVFALALTPGLALAKKGGNSSGSHGKGPNPNDSAYEHASDKAKFKRGDDWQSGKKGYKDDEYEYDESGKKIKSKKKMKQDDDEDDHKYRIREETRTEERVKERVRVKEDDSDGEKKRSEMMEQMRERILHQRNQDKE